MNNFLAFLKFFVKNTKDKGTGYKIQVNYTRNR